MPDQSADSAGSAAFAAPDARAEEEHGRTLRAARIGLHGIFIVLVGFAGWRALHTGAWPPAVVLLGAALLVLYIGGRIVRRRLAHGGWTALVWLSALCACWVAGLLVSPEFVWVSFPLLLVSGHLLRGWRGAAFGLAVVALAILVPWAVRDWAPLSAAEVVGPVIGGVFATGMARGYTRLIADAAEHRRLIASLLEARRETEELQAELARVQREAGASEERTRIARDLHDTVAQEFSSISLLARGAAPDARAELERIDAVARRGAEDVRRIVRALLPAELESTALTDALRRLVRGFAAETGIDAGFHGEPIRPLGTSAEVALLRTVQTGLANVRVHAAAGRVAVEAREVGSTVRVDIVDDGRGFDAASWERAERGASVGLREARERLRELGGGLEVESQPGEGTAIAAWLPLSAQAVPLGAAEGLADRSREGSVR